jgi:hypothetical protein
LKEEGRAGLRSEDALPKDGLLQPMPGHVLGAAAQACEPRTRAASAPGRQLPVRRRRGRGASPGAGRGHQPPNTEPSGPQAGPPGAHPAHPSSSLDPEGERWPKFRAAGLADHPGHPAALGKPHARSTWHFGGCGLWEQSFLRASSGVRRFGFGDGGLARGFDWRPGASGLSVIR